MNAIMNTSVKQPMNRSTWDKTQLKRDRFDGTVVSGVKKSVLVSFVSDNFSSYWIFCQHETQQKKGIKICFEYHNNLPG